MQPSLLFLALTRRTEHPQVHLLSSPPPPTGIRMPRGGALCPAHPAPQTPDQKGRRGREKERERQRGCERRRGGGERAWSARPGAWAATHRTANTSPRGSSQPRGPGLAGGGQVLAQQQRMAAPTPSPRGAGRSLGPCECQVRVRRQGVWASVSAGPSDAAGRPHGGGRGLWKREARDPPGAQRNKLLGPTRQNPFWALRPLSSCPCAALSHGVCGHL